MSSTIEIDLILNCDIELMKATDNKLVLSQQLETLKSEKEKITEQYKIKCDSFPLTNKELVTCLIDSSDSHTQSDIEEHLKIRDELCKKLEKIQKEIEATQKLHLEATIKHSRATRRSETLSKRILKVQQAVENHESVQKRLRHLGNHEHFIIQRFEKEKNEAKKKHFGDTLDKFKQDLLKAKQDFKETKRLVRNTKQVLARYRRYLQGRIDHRGRLIQNPVQNA